MEKVTELKSKGKIEIKHKFVNLRAKGHSIRSIAETLSVSPQTLVNWERDFNQEISELKAIQLEALYESFGLMKQRRLEEISRQLQKIQTTLSSRDLSDLSTEKLMELNLKYLERADKEYQEPKFFLQSKSNKTGTKLDSQEIAFELNQLLLRFRTGSVNAVEVQRELSILKSMLKSEEQADIQEMVEQLKTLLEGA